MNFLSETFLLIILPILLQNLVYVKEMNTPNRFGGVEYLGFEKLSFVPIQVFRLLIPYFLSHPLKLLCGMFLRLD